MANLILFAGGMLDFMLRLGNKYIGRLASDDPNYRLLSFAPWKIQITELEKETAGVTIINNVINPLNNERTLINFENDTAGMVVVQVFDWAGDLVDVLYRGRQGIGTFTYTWDGRNQAGNPAAVGLYFVRVTGPGVDEYRKVLVVK